MKKQLHPRNLIILLKVIWSGIGMTEGHGKLGGTVIQKGRYGFFARVKVTPVNTRTSYQQQIRSVLSYFSAKFRTLGESVVAGWNTAAQNGFTATNIFGNTIKRTGHSLYVGLNMNLQIISIAEITNAPTPEGVPSPIAIDPSADVSSTNMFAAATFQGATTTVPADTSLVVMATAPLSGGVTYVKSQLRIIDVYPAGVDTAMVSVWANYIAKFGAPVAGDRICMQVVSVNENTGEAGIPFKQIFTVVA